jgi:hypothetical protein
MPLKTISLKILSNAPEEILAFQKYLQALFNGDLTATTGIRASDNTHAKGRFDYGLYSFVLLSFELDDDGTIRPSSKAIRQLSESRQP